MSGEFDPFLPLRISILQALATYWDTHGYSPSIRDLMRLTGCKSTSHVAWHLATLRNLGWIVYDSGIGRSYRITSRGLVALRYATLL